MKRYCKFDRFAIVSETAKAYMVEVSTGHQIGGHNNFVWFPKSQVIVSAPNDVGVQSALVAEWLFKGQWFTPYHLTQCSYTGAILDA